MTSEVTHRLPMVVLLALLTLGALCFAAFPTRGTQVVMRLATGVVGFRLNQNSVATMVDPDAESRLERAQTKKNVREWMKKQESMKAMV